MTLSRRQLLRASGPGLLGASLGCRGSAPGTTVEPKLIGQSPERGHLLRSAELLGRSIDTRERVGVVIVGCGASGLSAAWRLRKAGFDDFVLLELEPEPGGTARTGTLPRSRHPMGAHYLPTPPRECFELGELLRDLGVIVGYEHDGTPEYRSTAICAAPEERHFHHSSWHEGLYPAEDQSPAEAAQWDRFWARLLEFDRARDGSGELLFRLPVRRSAARMRGLDKLSMAAWLDAEGFDSWRLRWFVDYACRDDYGCTIEQTSAFAGLHHFLGRGLEETRGGALLTWPGGNGELLAELREHLNLGERLRADSVAYAIDPEQGRVRVYMPNEDRCVELEAAAILWAAPRFLLPHVLPRGADLLEPAALSYAPWLVANLELTHFPGGAGAELAWDNVPIIEDPSARNLGYVVATHQEDRQQARARGTVITYYEPLVADDAAGLAQRRAWLLGNDAQALAEHTLRALEFMHPSIRKSLSNLHLHRWGHAMIRPVPGLLFGGALERARAEIGCVRACAADVGGLPLFEEAFYAAIEAADWALQKLGGR